MDDAGLNFVAVDKASPNCNVHIFESVLKILVLILIRLAVDWQFALDDHLVDSDCVVSLWLVFLTASALENEFVLFNDLLAGEKRYNFLLVAGWVVLNPIKFFATFFLFFFVLFLELAFC